MALKTIKADYVLVSILIAILLVIVFVSGIFYFNFILGTFSMNSKVIYETSSSDGFSKSLIENNSISSQVYSDGNYIEKESGRFSK